MTNRYAPSRFDGEGQDGVARLCVDPEEVPHGLAGNDNRFFNVWLCLFIHLSIYLFVLASIIWLFLCLFICPPVLRISIYSSVRLFFICRVFLSVLVPVHLCFCPSVSSCACLFVRPSFLCLFVHLTERICLSLCQCFLAVCPNTLSVYPPACLFSCQLPFCYLSICLPVSVSIFLSLTRYEESVVDKFKSNLLLIIIWLNILNYNS